MSSIWWAMTMVSFGVSAKAGAKVVVQMTGMAPAEPRRVRRLSMVDLMVRCGEHSGGSFERERADFLIA